uniref:Uncharacterized protein n=1 Tax=Arcella intermedia TaxID=1963864 RepID=A0A6B2LV51_9EUKA
MSYSTQTKPTSSTKATSKGTGTNTSTTTTSTSTSTSTTTSTTTNSTTRGVLGISSSSGGLFATPSTAPASSQYAWGKK